MNYLIVALIIGLILLIHEAGHFLAARLAKIPVKRFSVGLGPRLWGFQRGETDFCLSLIPFGGYVMPLIDSEDEFFAVSRLRRIAFSFGGPLANLVSVLPLLGILNAGLYGFSFKAFFLYPIVQVFGTINRIIYSIPQLFSDPQQLTGVVGIVSEGGRIVSSGAEGLITLAVVLSLNLAVLNLLPIPALDGGQIIMTILEKLSPKLRILRIPASILGWVFILSLIFYTTAKDINGLFT